MTATDTPTPTRLKLDACGFCGAAGNDSCREFLEDVPDHSDRYTELPDLFIWELDGPTGDTVEEAVDLLWEQEQYQMETNAENGWLRAAENSAQYAHEVEQDELRAAYGLPFSYLL